MQPLLSTAFHGPLKVHVTLMYTVHFSSTIVTVTAVSAVLHTLTTHDLTQANAPQHVNVECQIDCLFALTVDIYELILKIK